VKRFKIVCASGAAAAVFLLVQAILAQTQDLATLVQAGATQQALEQIRAGADIHKAHPDGTTPLLWAVNRQDYQVAEALLARKADPNAANEFGATPLTEAARLNDIRLVKMLLDAGAKVDSANPDDETALMLAIKNGNLAMAEMLVNAGANVNQIEKFHEQTPLIYAAAGGHAGIVKLLLSKGADVKPRSRYTDWPSQITSEPRVQYRPVGGLNALMYAVRAGCYSCVQMLLDAGADVNFPTPEGITPLMLALDNSHNEVAKLLMERGAYLDVWDWWGRTPLWIAVDRKPPPAGAGGGPAPFGAAGPGAAKGGAGGRGGGRGGTGAAPVAARDPDAPPPVSSMEIITALLDAGADPNPEMNFHRPNAPGRGRFSDNQVSTGTTALFRAVLLNDPETVELLLKRGANPNINSMGYTPFGLVSGNGPNERTGPQAVNFALMDLLAKYGADVNAKVSGTQSYSFHIGYGNRNDGPASKEGSTALHEAARNGRVDLVKRLLELGADPNILDADGQRPIDVIGKVRGAAPAAAAQPGGKGKGAPAGPSAAALAEVRLLLEAAGNSR
jgi:ankyrin repeat protein